MAKIKILGSGSNGNGYIIEAGGQSLIIELGMPYEDYIVNTDFSSIVACIVSHRHHDHFREKVAKRFAKMGVNVFANQDVHDAYMGKDNPIKVLEKGKANFFGDFVVQAIPLSHSVPNFGYLIKHPNFGRLVFATDTNEFNYKFKEINHWLIECNYGPNIVVDTKLSGEDVRSNYGDHLSKQKCFEVLQNNYGVFTKTITLIHLSDSNSNAKAFKQELQDLLNYDKIEVAGLTKDVKIINL